MNDKVKVIGIAGYARCGKDTFVGIAKKVLYRNGYYPVRIAFADELKKETERMLQISNFKATVYTEDSDLKKIIRPLLVWWGCQRRYESENGLYWVKVAGEQIHRTIAGHEYPDKLLFLVSDVRFPNEADWVHTSFNGEVIHLKRWSTKEVRDGYGDTVFAKFYDEAPNEEEAKNDPFVQMQADQKIEWESAKKLTSAEAIEDPKLQSVVLDALNTTKYFKHQTTGILF